MCAFWQQALKSVPIPNTEVKPVEADDTARLLIENNITDEIIDAAALHNVHEGCPSDLVSVGGELFRCWARLASENETN